MTGFRNGVTYLLLASCIYWVRCDTDDVSSDDANVIRYCGSKLADFLAEVCDSYYFQRQIKKSQNALKHKEKSVGYDGYDNLESRNLKDTRLQFPFIPRSDAALMAVLRRHPRGVADECCYKPCSLAEISGYCG